MEVNLDRECRLHKDGRQYHSCVDIPIAYAKEIPGVVSWDERKGRLYLEWIDVKSKVTISGGEARITQHPGYTGIPPNLVLTFPPGVFPPTPSGRFYFPPTPYLTLPFVIKLAVEIDLHPVRFSNIGITGSFAETITHRSPNDVRFHFPRTGKQLWATESGLRSSSPYFETLFSSSFVEATTVTIATGQSYSTVAKEPIAGNGEDSDDETDEIVVESSEALSYSATETTGKPFKTVTIIDASYSTYFATLVWMGTGNIRFAPLRSSFKYPSTLSALASNTRRQWLVAAGELHSHDLPLPCSPKSVYRLAHLLELDDLAQVALSNFQSQLSPEIVAYEIFTDTASTYTALRDVAVAYAVQNWKEVAKSKALKKVKERADSGELDSGILMALELMKEHGPK